MDFLKACYLIDAIEFRTGTYAAACFGGMVISEGIRVLYRFPQDSMIMRVLVLWVMASSLLHIRLVGFYLLDSPSQIVYISANPLLTVI